MQNAPIVFGNAMPKSGSHLIYQVLKGLDSLGPFVVPGFPPVTRSEANLNLEEDEVLANIQALGAGDIAYGYVHAREPFISALTQPDVATVFVYRDPRDVIVSHVFYATDMYDQHGMNTYYNEELEDMQQRIHAAIVGVDEPEHELSSIRTKYEKYMGWLEQPEVLSLRYEDLIQETENSLNRLLDHIESRGYVTPYLRGVAVEILREAIRPKASGTFRKGQPGEWKEHFSDANVAAFKEHTGDLLVGLGYEENSNW
ncbi:MAG: hypothetical protein DWQ07_19675 [Chloroflexi bacterium]|nr:MAG: hypothetical protein DWQ07_19675 [Chloroflexota bacterium]MBL1194303.1 hypothetical protein [Chloroflexota bacterium]NOH11593.1 hypothetical protein [Chloroflexota bacterium]